MTPHLMRMKDHMHNGQLKAGYNIRIGTEEQYHRPAGDRYLPNWFYFNIYEFTGLEKRSWL